MSRFGSQYRVNRSTGVCAETGQPIEPGAPCVAALCDDEEAILHRVDFSMESWESGKRPDGLFSFWKTRMPEKGEKKKVFVDDQVLLDIFERMAEDEREDRLAFRFVLGLILIRKRLFRHESQRKDEGGDRVVWLLRLKGSPPESPLVEMVNPGIGDDDILSLSEQLGDVLQGDL
ncbi:MAG: hypothetical protein P8I74_02250 [Phycisphaerales bacterium]|nr:hypothetical protein [Phycisphaerales bacterium]|tara:strand:+ start:3073 stop:3597 length:525 start_codon:yes stop_codon:yes gene_type:complete